MNKMVKFTRAQKFTKANVENISNNKAIVYELTNKAGKNLYTGIAGRGRGVDRLLEHKTLKKDTIPGATRFRIAEVNNKDRAEQIEKQIINKEQPKFNEQHK